MNESVFIVAEIGCNHNGDAGMAKEMIGKAKECGVDAVKFQTFYADGLISKYAPKAGYQILNTGAGESQLEMTRKLELAHEDYLLLKKFAEDCGLVVFSTPFDLRSIDFLYKAGQQIWKIPSGEITNLPYLEKTGSLRCENKKIIVSSGMAVIKEIDQCISVLKKSGTPESRMILLHCNTEYPTPDEDVNLGAIKDLKFHFPDLQVGFSDHSAGTVAAAGAVALGISVLEKHFTLDKNLPGPDHKASASPAKLKQLVQEVRRMEKMMGSGKKIVTGSEQKNKIAARKSIVAGRVIRKGELFTDQNITCKRPGNGISPMKWYDVPGKRAEKDFEEDELITLDGTGWQES